MTGSRNTEEDDSIWKSCRGCLDLKVLVWMVGHEYIEKNGWYWKGWRGWLCLEILKRMTVSDSVKVDG